MERGNLPESRDYLQSALSICDLHSQSTHITRGDALGCIAQLASVQGDPTTAVHYAQKSIDVFREHEPPIKEGTRHGWRLGQAYNELAEAYIAASRWQEGLEQAMLAIDRYFALPWEDYPDWAMMNKGWCLFHLGRHAEACEAIETFLEYQERTYGHMDTESFK